MPELSPDIVVRAFAGRVAVTARQFGVPRSVVYQALRCVEAERDWLLNLFDAGALSPAQLQRLAVLLDLLPLAGYSFRQAVAARTAAQTLLARVRQQSGGGALPGGTSQSSS